MAFFEAIDPISSGLRHVQEHKGCARAICLPVNGVVIGVIKPLALPFIAVVGSVAFPVIAGVNSCRGEHNLAKRYFHAWQVSVLTTLVCFGYLMLTGFALSPRASISLMAAVMSVSIAFHVFRTVKALQ